MMESLKHIRIVYGVVTHPLQSLHQAGVWVLTHPFVFVAVAIAGILLWLFDLPFGKRMVQWSLALFTVLSIVLGAL